LWRKSWTALRVDGSKMLKSWSRSTAVVVWLMGMTPPSEIWLSLVVLPGGSDRST